MVVSHRQASAPTAPLGHLHRSSDASGLADCAFFCAVFILVIRFVLRFVSVVALWFVLPAVGSALLLAVGHALLLAVGYALLPAVGRALLGSFHNFSPSRR